MDGDGDEAASNVEELASDNQSASHDYYSNGAHSDNPSLASSLSILSEGCTPSIELAFEDLSFEIPARNKHSKTKTILKNVTGVFRRGRVTAVLGPSGAGKSSLVEQLYEVLNGNTRNSKYITGSILVNGRDIRDPSMSKHHENAWSCGMVYQDDLIYESMTVREAIEMAAILRSNRNPKKRDEQVDAIIEVLGLIGCQESIIGGDLVRGISGGQKKRTAIGMELMANNPLLFLDEPTSGLDAFTALQVIGLLQQLCHGTMGGGYESVNVGAKTIVTTIHQPSYELLMLFDDVVIMAPGGHIIFMGPSHDLVAYFENTFFYTFPALINPTEYIFLAIINNTPFITEDAPDRPRNSFCSQTTDRHTAELDDSMSTETINRIEELTTAWRRSDLYLGIRVRIARSKRLAYMSLAEGDGGKRSRDLRRTFLGHLLFLIRREYIGFARNLPLMLTFAGRTLFMALTIGLIYLNSSSDSLDPRQRVRNLSGAIFFVLAHCFTDGFTDSIFFELYRRPIITREYITGYYSMTAYFWSQIAFRFPLGILTISTEMAIIYWMIGFTPAFSSFLFTAAFVLITYYAGSSLGYVVCALTDKFTVAGTLNIIIEEPIYLFSGVLVAASILPVYFRWLLYINSVHYCFEGMMGIQFDLNGGSVDGDIAVALYGLQNAFSPGIDIMFAVVTCLAYLLLAYVIMVTRFSLKYR